LYVGGADLSIPVSGFGAKFCIIISWMCPYFWLISSIVNKESTSSSGLSPIPISKPVVRGILNCPAFSSAFILTLGFLLGAFSCGIPFSLNRWLEDSSIMPRLTLVSFNNDISFFVILPALVCGSKPVLLSTISLISFIYSTVDDLLTEFSHAFASWYFCSGFSPVTNKASVQWSRRPASAIARTCSGFIMVTELSYGSFL
jgi:hypothetical protein